MQDVHKRERDRQRVAGRGGDDALDQEGRGRKAVGHQETRYVRIGEEEVVVRDDDQVALGEERREPSGHGRARDENETRVAALRDHGRERCALGGGDGVVDVVHKDGVMPLRRFDGDGNADVGRLGVDLQHIKALEHSMGKLGLAEAERSADERDAGAAPLRPEAFVEL